VSTHPVFLIVRAKLGEATKALAHMNELDVQQRALRVEHPGLASLSGEAWHRDLLLQAAAAGTDRPEMIGPAVLDGMSELLRFRHAVRNN
jgi:hypothetical protein